MNETIIMWLLGLIITGGASYIFWSVKTHISNTERFGEISERVAIVETAMEILGRPAARKVHSDDTPDIDHYLDKFLDREYELSFQEWTELKSLCETYMERYEKAGNHEKSDAVEFLYHICRHKLRQPPEKYMKNIKPIASFILVASLGFILAGCASNGAQPPPSTLDKAVFNVTTNIVQQTNLVTLTNTVTQVVQQTNASGTVVQQTNVIFIPVVTNMVHDITNYIFTPKPEITQTASTVGAFLGPWGTIGSAAISGLLGLFAFFKNKQVNVMTEVAGSSQIALQTARQVIAAMPNGDKLTVQFNAWLAAHQNDVNIATELSQVIDDYVDPTHTQTIASGIISQVTTPIVPNATAAASIKV